LIGRAWRGALGLVFFLFIGAGPIASAQAAELVMFEAKGCPYCARWDADIGPHYAKTEEGRLLALRRVDVDEPRPDDLKAVVGIRFTPTFVVLDRGHEVGRIVGYIGEYQFWGLLGKLVERLKDQ
jgi:thioredoxin-related protein